MELNVCYVYNNFEKHFSGYHDFVELELCYIENDFAVYFKGYHNVLELKFQHFYWYVCDDYCKHILDYFVEFKLCYISFHIAVYNEEYLLDIELELQLPYLWYNFENNLADYQLGIRVEYKLLTRSLLWRRYTLGCISLFYFKSVMEKKKWLHVLPNALLLH